MLESLSLKGKVALVTGATKGIGRGIVEGFAKSGADLVVVSRNQEDCEKVAREIESYGANVLPHAADIRKLDSIDELIQATVKKFDKIDILVNNAGAAITKSPESLKEEEWDFIVDLNLKGAFFTAQRIGLYMIKQNFGKIINIGSIFSFVGDANIVAYCASKGGLIQMTRSLALAWAKYNIQVNALAPGYIETELNYEVLNDEKVHKHLMRNTPVRRLGKVDDVVGAAVYLASPASDYMTGQSIVVDGGWTAH